MLALVTGANGFVGSHLVDELNRRGHDVRALVRRSSDLRLLDTQNCELIYGNLSTGELPAEALEGVDWLFHVAAQLHTRDWDEIRRINVDASVALYRRFADVASTDARFVFVSSQAAAGPSGVGPPLRETDPPHPQTLYGKSKLEAEVALAAMQGPALSIVRPPTVYGARDSATLPLFKLAARGWALCVGSRTRRISMIHVDDLVQGLVQCAAHAGGAGTWFLTDGSDHPWSEIAAALQSTGERRVRILTVPDAMVQCAGAINEAVHRMMGRSALFDRAKARDFTTDGWLCSSEAASAAFGYTPRVSLRGGMGATMNWYRKEGWL